MNMFTTYINPLKKENLQSRGIRTDTKLKLLTKIDLPRRYAFGKSMQKNWPKIVNWWLKRPPKFRALSGFNFGATAT